MVRRNLTEAPEAPPGDRSYPNLVKFSVTITRSGNNVSHAMFWQFCCLMSLIADGAVCSLEKGSSQRNLHIQAVICIRFDDSWGSKLNRYIKKALAIPLRAGYKVQVKSFDHGSHTYVKMSGYVQKDRFENHFLCVAINTDTSTLERGQREYEMVSMFGRSSLIKLNRKNLLFHTFKYWDANFNPYPMDTLTLLTFMHQQAEATPDVSLVLPGHTSSFDYGAVNSYMKIIQSDPESINSDDIWELYFRNRDKSPKPSSEYPRTMEGYNILTELANDYNATHNRIGEVNKRIAVDTARTRMIDTRQSNQYNWSEVLSELDYTLLTNRIQLPNRDNIVIPLDFDSI